MGSDIAGVYSRVSGSSVEDCVALAGRYEGELGYRPPHLETWVVMMTPNRLDTTFWAKRGWLSGIWRSDSGTVYVSDMDRALHHRAPDPNPANAKAWKRHPADGNMMGVWGLDDGFVMAWGLAEKATPCMMLWEGREWRSIDSPAFLTWAIHGTRRDLVFAAGDNGRVARWDGSSWTEMTTPATGALASIYCVNEDEVYACGWGKELLRGSAYGWTQVLQAEETLHCVTQWRDEIWVGAALPLGLCKLQADELVQVVPGLMMQADTRENLLFTANSRIAQTEDGAAFTAKPIENFLQAVENDPPSWR